MRPFARASTVEAAGARRGLLRGRAGRVLRHRRPQRLGQEHAAEAAREHLPRRRRADPDRRRLAPFIELGVGFNLELSARDNVVLNGVMMGLTPREARRRFDEVIEFAELEEFVELKLKNYSSGMLVRLGFSLMTQVDADVLLIDEVLAVGDAAFQQKSFDAFSRLHREGRTIVLVTHDMHTVEGHCDRAMLLERGPDPRDRRRRRRRAALPAINFEHRRAEEESEDVRFRGGRRRGGVRRRRIVDESGGTVTSIEARAADPDRDRDRGEDLARVERPMFGFQILDGDGLQIFFAQIRAGRQRRSPIAPSRRASASSCGPRSRTRSPRATTSSTAASAGSRADGDARRSASTPPTSSSSG